MNKLKDWVENLIVAIHFWMYATPEAALMYALMRKEGKSPIEAKAATGWEATTGHYIGSAIYILVFWGLLGARWALAMIFFSFLMASRDHALITKITDSMVKKEKEEENE